MSGPGHEHAAAPAAAAARKEDAGAKARPGGGGSPAAVLALQRSAGNAAVASVLARRASTPGPPPPAFPDADPAGVLRSGLRTGRHPQFPGVMGQIFYSEADLSFPRVGWEIGRTWTLDYDAKPRDVETSTPSWSGLATPANADGYQMANEHPNHPGYSYKIRVTDAAAAKIAAAEQQHLADLARGWALTGRLVANAISIANYEDPVEGATAQQAKANAAAKMASRLGQLGPKVLSTLEAGGSTDSALAPLMNKAFLQSRKRDDSGGHTLPLKLVSKDDTAKTVLYEVDSSKELDGRTSNELISHATIL